MRLPFCLRQPRTLGDQPFRYDSEDSSPEPPKIETYRPPGTYRTACCTSLAFLAGFRNETHRRKNNAFRCGCCPVLPNRRQPVSDRIMPDWQLKKTPLQTTTMRNANFERRC